jgi:hypothetical protein
MTHAEAVQRIEEIERELMRLFKIDKSSWTEAQLEELTNRKIDLALDQEEARYCLDKSHKMHLDRNAFIAKK